MHNGTLNSGSTLVLGINLFQGSTSITGYEVTIKNSGGAAQNYNENIPIEGFYPSSISSGSYTVQYEVTGTGTQNFYTNNGYILPEAENILQNSIQENFQQNANTQFQFNMPYGNWCNTYTALALATGYSQSLSSTEGLELSAASSSGAAAQYGVVSQTTLDLSKPASIIMQTYLPSSTPSGVSECVAVSHTLLQVSL